MVKRLFGKTSLRRLGLTIAILIGPALITLPAFDFRRACIRGHDWVLSHGDNLPSSFEALVALPLEYRRAAYVQLNRRDQVAMWRMQLDRFLGASTSLSAKQRAVLVELRDDLRGADFPQRTPRNSIAFIREVFGDRRDVIKLLTQLGPDKGSFATVQAAILTFQDRVRRLSYETLYARHERACHCFIDWDTCFEDNPTEWCEVHMDPNYCTYDTAGCGVYQLDPCNGTCEPMMR